MTDRGKNVIDFQASRHNARDALLRAAQKLFVEKGYDAVSTRELAEAAKVNLGAIQYHFGSKARLFVETIHGMMKDSGKVSDCLTYGGEVVTNTEAAQRICLFIFLFLDHLLCPKGPQPCRLMIREIFTGTSQDEEMCEALISSVVKDFTKPLHDAFGPLILLLNPELDEDGVRHVTQSIIGQCTYYVTHRPFIERLTGNACDAKGHFYSSVEHISRFSLGGLGCSKSFIDGTVPRIIEKFKKKKPALSDFTGVQ